MEFKSEAQKACYAKVGTWMKELFGEQTRTADSQPTFGVQHGSAFALVSVWPWGDNDATVSAGSCVVTDVEMSPDLMRYLLQQNYEMRFGAFSVDGDGDIFFEHSIVGSTLDKEELKTSVLAVLFTADKYDDEIRSRWGGQRAMDRG